VAAIAIIAVYGAIKSWVPHYSSRTH
jgi:hypothetical protein